MLRRVCSALLLTSLLASPAWANDGLAERADALVARMAPSGSQVGVSVVDLHSGEVLYSHQANDLFTPASTLKLLTSCAALAELGLQFRLVTRVKTNSVVSNGVLQGHLYLQGDGDPTLEASDLDAMAASLARQGVKEVAGDLIADASAFANEGAGGPGWSCDDLPWGYAAPACGLSLHRNEIDLAVSPGDRPGTPLHVALTPRTDFVKLACQAKTQAADGDGKLDVRDLHGLAPAGPISWALLGGLPRGAGTQVLSCSVADPAHFTATVFEEALARHGVHLDGHIRLGVTPSGSRTRAQH
ncbi:MAG TPA: D-alanyl-D-alanine carboxypeptidase/D-alanyl-D-alanine-endopeptidase, partial [Oscillatoriaceae cyanobacterium]